jgi:site-specific DNA recombinase
MNRNTFVTQSAYIYLRVSTDEQAIKGSSLKIQEEVLRQYCVLRNFNIDKIFVEDHSAKTFNRPQWKKLIGELNQSKSRPTLLLFTRWDRFSRNTGQAYYAIKTLRQLGVEPHAIEQPLDLSIPENGMMLAFYLAIPQVENERRGLNVKQGIKKAKELGKWVGPAPLGYENNCAPNGLKSLVQKEPEASILRIAFEQVASLTHNKASAYRHAINAGLNCSRSNFFRIMRNPVYAGNVAIKESGTANTVVVPGLHIGIITPVTFDKIQQLLSNDGRKNEIDFSPRFPLRGFMRCSTCEKVLRASASSGRSKTKYYYYHCISSCGFRIRVDALNDIFLDKLKTLRISKGYLDLYKNIVSNIYQKENRRIMSGKLKAIHAIEQFADRIAKAKNLLLDGYIDFPAFAEIKNDFETKIEILGDTVSSYSKNQLEFTERINNSGQFLSKMDVFYCQLKDEYKRSFLNHILIKPTHWNYENLSEIFIAEFQEIYTGADVIHITDIQPSPVKKLLETLAQIELSIREE